MSRGQLEESLAWAPKSSLRVARRRLCDQGALLESEPSGNSHPATFTLTAAGRELLAVADSLEAWLAAGPAGPLSLDDPVAQGIVGALAAGWDSTIIRTLAERPRTLAELDSHIPTVNYPSLKRRLDKLCSTGLIVQGVGRNGYEVSEWLRRATRPLVQAARWERRHGVGPDRLNAMEVEAAFLLAMPLVELPRRATGACTLSVLLSSNGGGPAGDVASISLEVSKGRIVAVAIGATPEPDTWALGDSGSWFAAVIEGDPSGLRIKGAKPKLAKGAVAGLYEALSAD